MQAIPQKSSNLLSAAEINQAYRTAFSQYFDDGKRRGLTSVNRLLRKQQYPTDPGLQYILAYLYINGHLPSKHQNEAIQAWLYRAAKNGSNDAVYMIAYGHETADWGFPKDEQKMFAYYRLAAEDGHMYAQYRYGLLLLKNEEALRPTYRDQKKLDEQNAYALNMLAYSAQQGYALAVEMLGSQSQEENQIDNFAVSTNTEEHPVQDLTIAEMLVLLKEYVDQLFFTNNQTFKELLSAQTADREVAVQQLLSQIRRSEQIVTKVVEDSAAKMLEEAKSTAAKVISAVKKEGQNTRNAFSSGMENLRNQHHNALTSLGNQNAELAEKLKEEFLAHVREIAEATHDQLKRSDKNYKKNAQKKEKALANCFGVEWKKMSQHTRNAILVATLLSCQNNEDHLPDYGWLVIEIIAAFEAEAKSRFFIGYKMYLEENGIDDVEFWPVGFTFQKTPDAPLEKSIRFKLGAFLDILKYDPKYHTMKNVEYSAYTLSDYYKAKNWSVPAFQDNDSYLNKIRKFVDTRNKAAHGDMISEKIAKEHFKDILGFSCDNEDIQALNTNAHLLQLLAWTTPVPERQQPPKQVTPSNHRGMDR